MLRCASSEGVMYVYVCASVPGSVVKERLLARERRTGGPTCRGSESYEGDG